MFSTVNLKKLVTSLLLPLLIGLFAGFLTRGNMDIYQRISVPPLAPPSVAFPIVWTILYILMGISLYIVRVSRASGEVKKIGYIFYALQLFFNFIWSILFFNLGAYTFSAVWLAVMIVLILLNIIWFGKVNNVSAYLLIPYLVWCLFALYLNIGIAILN